MLTNKELINAIADATGTTKVATTNFLKALVAIIPANGGASITDFGKFTIKERTGTIPGTNKPYKSNGLTFKQSSVVKKAIN